MSYHASVLFIAKGSFVRFSIEQRTTIAFGRARYCSSRSSPVICLPPRIPSRAASPLELSGIIIPHNSIVNRLSLCLSLPPSLPPFPPPSLVPSLSLPLAPFRSILVHTSTSSSHRRFLPPLSPPYLMMPVCSVVSVPNKLSSSLFLNQHVYYYYSHSKTRLQKNACKYIYKNIFKHFKRLKKVSYTLYIFKNLNFAEGDSE